MSSLPILFSSAIYNSILTISTPNKAEAYHRHANNINGHGRSVRIPVRSTPRVLFQPSAIMVDDTSSSVMDGRPRITPLKPSMWGDVFSTFSLDNQVQQKYSEEIETLKKEARSMLMAATSNKLIVLIDTLERLGLAYHFETEIEDKLKQVYASVEEEEEEEEEEEGYDVFTTALRFRLLRQHRYHVSCNALVKFVDKDNKFKESLSSDVEGLLSLYEAAHVRIHDENVLEEAVAFTTHHLTRMLPQLESPLKEEVQHALRYPLHKSLGILNLRFRIEIYERDDTRDELVLRLAKFNFNFMQNIIKNELFEFTIWWNNFNLTSKVPYSRDRVVENYLWGLSYHVEPDYAPLRMLINKCCMIAMVVDDTYDNYATLEEIELFTEALQRWNMDEIDLLPDNLKLVYKCVMSFSEEFEREAEKQGKAFVVPYYIEAMKQAGRGYAQEQKWIMERQIPSFEEYMINSRITSFMYVTFIIMVAVIKSAPNETIDWVLSDPDIFIYTNEVGRLLDDLATHERESKDGTMPTPVDYYMKRRGVTIDEAKNELRELIEDKWKHLSAAWVNSSMVPKEIAIQFLDLARLCGTLYGNEEDGFTYPEKNVGPLIAAFLLDPILIT